MPPPSPSRRSRTPLSRERVLRAAIGLADEGGIESLTMRTLARELGVEAMSLYNHVVNKGDLVDAMVDLVIDEIDLPATGDDWNVAVRQCAISANETFLRHPWACGLVMGPTTTRTVHLPRLRYMEWLLERLRSAGFSPELTYHAYHALDSYIMGFTMWQLGHAAGARNIAGDQDLDEFVANFIPAVRGAGYPHVAEHAEQHLAGEGVSEFEFGLDLILDGLERSRVSASRA